MTAGHIRKVTIHVCQYANSGNQRTDAGTTSHTLELSIVQRLRIAIARLVRFNRHDTNQLIDSSLAQQVT